MNRRLTKKDLPRFSIINKYNVTIKSLRNQLKHATGIDELTNIAAKIIDLEQQVMTEKSNGYKQLAEEKKLIERRIDTLARELSRAKGDLDRVGNSLDFKINGYRKKLQAKIDSLNDEFSTIMGFMSSTPSVSSLPSTPSLSSAPSAASTPRKSDSKLPKK